MLVNLKSLTRKNLWHQLPTQNLIGEPAGLNGISARQEGTTSNVLLCNCDGAPPLCVATARLPSRPAGQARVLECRKGVS